MKKGRYGKYIHKVLTLFDFVILNIVFLIVMCINPGIPALHLRLVWLLLNVAYLPVARWLGKVHKERSIQMDKVLRCALQAVAGHALTFITLLYIMGVEDIPWTVLLEFYGISAVVFMFWWSGAHFFIKRYRRRGGNYTKVIIIGCGPSGIRLYNEMQSDAGFGYRCIGFFDIYCPPDFPWKHLYKGNLSEIEQFVVDTDADEIFYTLSGENGEAVQLTLGLCEAHMLKFHYVPQISPYLTRNFRLGAMGAMPLLEIRNNPLERPMNSALKRGFDIVFSGIFLVFSPFIFIPVAIAIKMSSPGPVFFKQKRTGYKGNEFMCWKFRTMRVNTTADSVQASKNDPRKTKVGDFLRRSSIDELPQFINVLMGDMSVVGPRPHMLKHTEDYRRLIDKYMVRHLIKPGITGWAQVKGYRGQTEELWQMERRVEHDIWYIEHWSFLLDIKIIARTIINALGKEENAF